MNARRLFLPVVATGLWLAGVPASGAEPGAPAPEAPPAATPVAQPAPSAPDAKPEEAKPAPAPDAKPEEAKPAEVGDEKKEEKPEEKAGPKPDEKKEEKPQFKTTPLGKPLGAAGRSRVPQRVDQNSDHFLPIPDRWRVGLPDWSRYPSGEGAPYRRSGGLLDPFNQNVLKADYPLFGQNVFLNLIVLSDTLVDYRRRPTPSGVSSARPGSFEFFGSGRQWLIDETITLSLELFRGDTQAFRPKDWAVRVTPAFNLNRLIARETGVVDIDVREGVRRTSTDIGLQEFFGEYKIADLSPKYDFLSVRGGIQGFNADFRGLLFFDNQPGVRFFGNSASNRNQFNLSYFHPLEKDTYSRLNRVFRDRGQEILVANYFRQDLIRPGYTGQFLLAYNDDHGDRHFDNNGRSVRPPLLGDHKQHEVRVGYFGFNGDGHIGRINVNHTFYQAFGIDDHNPIATRSTRINAQLATIEASYDKDWMRFRASMLYASGDGKPRDGRARGWDSIFDNPAFAGGGFSFWQSQAIPLTSTGVLLVDEGSFFPTLRSSKLEGQPNFVNPGLLLFNMGYDADLSPKWKVSLNANYMQFDKTHTLELVLKQAPINKSIGFDYSIGFRHRPFLNDNVVILFGASALVPGKGFTDIYSNKTLFSGFFKLRLAY